MKISRIKDELFLAILKRHSELDQVQAGYFTKLVVDRLYYLRGAYGPHLSIKQVAPDLSGVCFRYADSWGGQPGRPAPDALFETISDLLIGLSQED